MDYASEDTKRIGEALIESELGNISSDKVRKICSENLEKIQNGIRRFQILTEGVLWDLMIRQIQKEFI